MRRRRGQGKKRHPLRKFVKFVVIVAVIVLCIIGVTRVYHIYETTSGKQSPDVPSMSDYPVRGVDVSYYQGNVDWETIAAQGITFAFIKATEGTDYVDSQFAQNWETAQLDGLYVGAYHFYRFEDSGADQAELFLRTVSPTENMLPPVIDVELYDTAEALPDAKSVRENLREMCEVLEAYYGVTPILYCSQTAYWRYVWPMARDYYIWRSNYAYKPYGRWTFWQYTDSGTLEGYDGDQQCVDLNVFNGTREEFLAMFGLE